MEKWQREYIRENLPTLVRDTPCDTLLITCLVNADVFGVADIAKLKSMTDPHDQSYELYKRAQTLTDAYQKLINALHAADQKGIVEILQYGYVKYKLPVPEIPLPIAPGRAPVVVVTTSPIGAQGHHAAGPTNQNFSPPKEVVDSAKEEMESATTFSGKRRRN